MWQRFLRYTQEQLSQIMIFGKTFSKSKLLFQILPLNRKLLQGNPFRQTHHITLSIAELVWLLVVFVWLLVILLILVFSFVVLTFPLVVLVFPLAVIVCSLVVLVRPPVVSVCPLVVLVVLSVSLFITAEIQPKYKLGSLRFFKAILFFELF